MTTDLQSKKLAEEIRQRALLGHRPNDIAYDLGLSGDYIRKVILNKRAYSSEWESPERVNELRLAHLATRAKLGYAIGLPGRLIGLALNLSEARASQLRRSEYFTKRASLEIELTQELTVDGKKLPIGQYAISAYESTFRELLIIGGNHSLFISPMLLVGCVELCG